MIWFINYPQDQIIILSGDEILSELPGDEGLRIIVLLQHERFSDGHPSPIHYYFPLNTAMFDGIYDKIIIIIDLDPLILLQVLGFAFLIIFLGGGSLPIFINIGTEYLQMTRLPISRRLIWRVTKVLLKMIPIIDGRSFVTNFRFLGPFVEDDGLFLQVLNFGSVPLD